MLWRSLSLSSPRTNGLRLYGRPLDRAELAELKAGSAKLPAKVRLCDAEGVASDMVAEFSCRTRAIEEVLAEKAHAQEAERGREFTRSELGVLHGHAWRETRRKKQYRPLAEMTARWSERARPWVGEAPAAWAAGFAGQNQFRALHAADITDEFASKAGTCPPSGRRRHSVVHTEHLPEAAWRYEGQREFA